jgi:hypothetical protein
MPKMQKQKGEVIQIQNISRGSLCGIICIMFCCATALGQNLNNNATGTVLNESAAAEVSAGVSATIFASITPRLANPISSAPSSLIQGGTNEGSEASATSTTFNSLIHVPSAEAGSNSHQAMRGSPPASALSQGSKRFKERQLPGFGKYQATLGEYRTADLESRASKKPTMANAMQQGAEDAAGGQSNQAGEYTDDFPDSTKGTALVSPPDSGTASPLDWSSDLDFGFTDLSQERFLTPTLHIAQRVGASRQGQGHRQGMRQTLRMRSALSRSRAGKAPNRDIYSLPTSTFDQRLKPKGLPQLTPESSTLNSFNDLQQQQ